MAHIHRARNPDLWSPVGQPIRPVEIDWTHPLAQRLVGYWLFTGPLPLGARNLVTGAPLPINGGAPAMIVDAGGVAVRANGNAGGLSSEPYGDSGQVPFTFATQIERYSESTANTGISCVRASGALRNFLTITATHVPGYTASYGAGASLTATTAMQTGLPYTLVGTTRAASDHELFVNGASEAVSTATVGTTIGQRNQLLFAQIGGNNGRDLYYYWMAAWARGFSAEDAAMLAATPYAFLKPAG